MNRRSKEVQGFVKFPVDDPAYKNTMEGGMYVRLVVGTISNKLDTYKHVVCAGGDNVIIKDGVLLSTDTHRRRNYADLERDMESRQRWEQRTFPNLFDNVFDTDTLRRYQSIPYLAIVTIGSTGWSGWHIKKEAYWSCTYNDLSDAGQGLYQSLASLYPNCLLTLQTWLDT